MKNLLLVGENPFSTTGNAKMMRYVIKQINSDRYCFHVFSIDSVESDPVAILSRPIPFPIISSLCQKRGDYEDPRGPKRLLEILSRKQFDLVLFVGSDVWKYADIYKELVIIKKQRGIVFGGLFPYDQQVVREDWIPWFNAFDFPCVYSEFGYNLLKDKVKNLRYFRPDIPEPNHFKKLSQDKKETIRKVYFPHVKKDAIVFGFFGPNQFRKDPQKIIQAFGKLKQDPEVENIEVKLYMHTDNISGGVYNLTQTAIDSGLEKTGDLMVKQPGDWFTDGQISDIMNSVDCLVNCSMQEGLSWTVIEAMYCGTPVICSHSTAHIELLEGTDNIGVPCTLESALPSITGSGSSFIPTLSCTVDDIYNAMKKVALDSELRKRMSESGLKKIASWSKRRSNVNDLFGMVEADIMSVIENKKKSQDKILFAQHASAGDVLMTTKCFKGIKDRHPGSDLVYMTQKKYQGIVEGNPFIDGIIDWDEDKLRGHYKIVYNPHGERIRPGHWGRNSNSLLSDFYWKIIDVPKNPALIVPIPPSQGIQDVILNSDRPICIVHTTGQDADFRVYKFMPEIVKEIKDRYLTVSIGGKTDYPSGAELVLNNLPWREAAWVVQHATIGVTVDTFQSHLLGVFGVSQVCLFGPTNMLVVRPDQTAGMLIARSIDYVKHCNGLGPCSGQVRECVLRCNGLHDPKDVLQDFKRIEAYIAVKKVEGYDNVRQLPAQIIIKDMEQ